MLITKNEIRDAAHKVGETMAKVLNDVVEGLNPTMHERWSDGWAEHDEVFQSPVVEDPFTSSKIAIKHDNTTSPLGTQKL